MKNSFPGFHKAILLVLRERRILSLSSPESKGSWRSLSGRVPQPPSPHLSLPPHWLSWVSGISSQIPRLSKQEIPEKTLLQCCYATCVFNATVAYAIQHNYAIIHVCSKCMSIFQPTRLTWVVRLKYYVLMSKYWSWNSILFTIPYCTKRSEG